MITHIFLKVLKLILNKAVVLFRKSLYIILLEAVGCFQKF